MIDIRPAVESDSLGIAKVHVHTWQTAYRGIVSDAYLESLSVTKRESIWREAIAVGNSELWIADAGSEIVGWVAFGASRDADAVQHAGELWAIYVMPTSWSMGLGRNLWLTAKKRLMERGFLSATLWVLKDNLRAIRFYRAAGFEEDPTSEKEIIRGDQRLREVRYATALI
jgi:ribosomal protein S18 acetylase RimI-like enzyme